MHITVPLQAKSFVLIPLAKGIFRPGSPKRRRIRNLEDETGFASVVVWNALVESQRRGLLGAQLLGVEGVVEREGDVVQLVARRFSDHSAMLGALKTESRGFR
jgi:error-prone DNA polymerase